MVLYSLEYQHRNHVQGFDRIFPQLVQLDLSHNRIEQYHGIMDLKYNTRLERLALKGNVLCLNQDYRLQMIHHVPQLQELDNRYGLYGSDLQHYQVTNLR